MRTLVLPALISLAACAAPRAETPASPERRGEAPTPLPAGSWAAESPHRTSCIDCPSPRFAVVLATGSLAAMARARAESPPLPAGYPRVVASGELGLELAGELALVAGLYREDGRARRAALDWGGRVMAARPDQPSARTVVTITAPRSAALAAPDGETVCPVTEGDLFLVERAAVLRPVDAMAWVPVRCGDERAYVPIVATDLDRTVWMAEGRTRSLQPTSGVCGVTFYELRERSVGGETHRREVTSRPSCVGEGTPGDPWGVCPGRSLEGCARRARVVLGEGDTAHATRLASYACRFGRLEACTTLVELAPYEGLSELHAACDEERGDACDRLDAALRATDPARTGDPGMLALTACRRGHEPWCVALDRSELCDREGCG